MRSKAEAKLTEQAGLAELAELVAKVGAGLATSQLSTAWSNFGVARVARSKLVWQAKQAKKAK